jgi:hypothetical protein
MTSLKDWAALFESTAKFRGVDIVVNVPLLWDVIAGLIDPSHPLDTDGGLSMRWSEEFRISGRCSLGTGWSPPNRISKRPI